MEERERNFRDCIAYLRELQKNETITFQGALQDTYSVFNEMGVKLETPFDRRSSSREPQVGEEWFSGWLSQDDRDVKRRKVLAISDDREYFVMTNNVYEGVAISLKRENLIARYEPPLTYRRTLWQRIFGGFFC